MSLRAKVLRGGVYLVLRQALGIVVSAVGMILLTRAIGPGAYGLYVAVLGIFGYLNIVCRWGMDVYLVRREEDPQPHDYHQAFSLLLLLGLAGVGLAILALPLLERWVRLEGFEPVAVALFALLPVTLLQLVPLAHLERALDYRRIALIELLGQIAVYVVALPLAYQGQGAWAPVGGMWASQLLTLVLLYRVSAYRPQLLWESDRVRAMVGYGLGLSASGWLWELRTLVNPLVVGRYSGAEAVGQIALAIRLVDQLSSVLYIANRLSVPVFARLQGDRVRLIKAVTEGISLQIMVLGPLLAVFGLFAYWIVPLLFGPQWLPALEVYPFIALIYLSHVVFHLHVAALYVLRKVWEVAVFHLAHIVLLAGAALLLVPHLGLRGYGWAEVAALPSYILLLFWFQVYLGRLRYIEAGIWFTAWAVPLFTWQIGSWVWISVTIPLIWPATRRELLEAVLMMWRTRRRYR